MKYAYTLGRRRRRRGPGKILLVVFALIGVTVGAAWFLSSGGSGTTAATRAHTACASDAPCASPVISQSVADDDPRPSATPGLLLGGVVSSQSAPAPEITAKAAVVVEETCGAILYGLNMNQRLPPASLTKIVSALVAAERLDLSKAITVQIDGEEFSLATDSTVMGLKPGQTFTAKDLIYGMMLPSGNDASIALAEATAGSVSGFVTMMNQKVNVLGLDDTHFSNPHGLDDPELYSSAYDMAVLGRTLLRQPALAEVARSRVYEPATGGQLMMNLNQLLDIYPGAVGVKIGFTDEALGTIVGAADRNGRRIVVSILGSAGVFGDATALLDWAFESTTPACGQRTG